MSMQEQGFRPELLLLQENNLQVVPLRTQDRLSVAIGAIAQFARRSIHELGQDIIKLAEEVAP
jgi:hypothetical protein